MKINNFYPLTPDVSKKLLEAKLTAAEWRIWIYLVGIDPWGDIYKDIDTLTVMAECDVSKATFYRAIAKFQELELFDIQDKGISIRNLKGVSSLKNETPVSEMRQDSQNCETRRKNETKKSKMRQDSQNCENQPPEPTPSKASEVPHTIQTKTDLTDTTEAENCCVLKKFEDRLKIHGIHLYIFNENSKTKNLAGYGILPNPKMCAIRKIIEGMPPERAERAIAAFLAWLPNSKNIRCKYAAFATSLRQNWES
jgi:hypothetical protein